MMETMIEFSFRKQASISFVSWHILAMSLINSYNYFVVPVIAEVVTTVTSMFKQAWIIGGYIPIAVFIATLKIPSFSINIKWHQLRLSLYFKKEKSTRYEKVGFERPLKRVLEMEYMNVEIIIFGLTMYDKAWSRA